MEIQAYQHSYDYFQILQMLLESQDYKDMEYVTPESLPEIGFLVSDSATHIAMGFLRRVEGGYAQIDGLTTNKSLSSETRHQGLTLLVDTLIKTAKDLNLLGIICFSNDCSTIERAEAIGFRVIGSSVISLRLQ